MLGRPIRDEARRISSHLQRPFRLLWSATVDLERAFLAERVEVAVGAVGDRVCRISSLSRESPPPPSTLVAEPERKWSDPASDAGLSDDDMPAWQDAGSSPSAHTECRRSGKAGIGLADFNAGLPGCWRQ